MADEIREVVKAAQEAEIRGNRADAAELLARAAGMYRSVGRASRALSMLKHALRLDRSRPGLEEDIRTLEAAESANGADHSSPESAEEDHASDDWSERVASWADAVPGTAAVVESDMGAAVLEVIERGPTLADSTLGAWCSFCCRPSRDVGKLVAGPSGSYMWLSCVAESSRLLGGGLARETATAAPNAQRSLSTPATLVRPQAVAAAAVMRALEGSARFVLLVGSPGVGKSTVVRSLVAGGAGRVLADEPASTLAASPVRAYFVDAGAEPPSADTWQRIAAVVAASGPRIVVALRGVAPALAAVARVTGAQVPIASSRAIAASTGDVLPLELAERVEEVVVLSDLDEESLAQIAAVTLITRGAGGAAAVELSNQIAGIARASGRNGYEAAAIARRIPTDTTALASPESGSQQPASSEATVRAETEKPRGKGRARAPKKRDPAT